MKRGREIALMAMLAIGTVACTYQRPPSTRIDVSLCEESEPVYGSGPLYLDSNWRKLRTINLNTTGTSDCLVRDNDGSVELVAAAPDMFEPCTARIEESQTTREESESTNYLGESQDVLCKADIAVNAIREFELLYGIGRRERRQDARTLAIDPSLGVFRTTYLGRSGWSSDCLLREKSGKKQLVAAAAGREHVCLDTFGQETLTTDSLPKDYKGENEKLLQAADRVEDALHEVGLLLGVSKFMRDVYDSPQLKE